MSDILLEQLKTETDLFKKAKLILSLKQHNKIPVVKISQELNLKPSYVSHILRLNKLPELIADGHYSGIISVSHLFIISRLNKEEDMIEVYEKVLADNLTALQTEELVRQKLYNLKNDGSYLDPSEIETFEKLMEEQEFDVKVIQSRVKGKITLEIKGNLAKNSMKLRELMNLLKSKKSTQV